MEPTPRSFVVGVFALIIFASGLLFVLWYSRVDLGRSASLYQINFRGAVTGLGRDQSVYYLGIPIGRVTKIRVDKRDVEAVKVIVSIDKPTLIREDSRAKIEVKGLTGASFIQITGSSQDSPQLETLPGEKYPVIQSEPSPIEALFSDLPKILHKTTQALTRIESLLDDQTISDTKMLMANLKNLSARLESGPNSLDTLVHHSRSAVLEIKGAAATLKEILGDNRAALDQFAQFGLPAFERAMGEVEASSSAIRDLVSALAQSPGEFLHKSSDTGVKVDE